MGIPINPVMKHLKLKPALALAISFLTLIFSFQNCSNFKESANDLSSATANVNNSPTGPSSPTSDLQWLSVSAQWTHACGITPQLTVKCWGDNKYSQIGAAASSMAYSKVPVDVQGLSNVTQIAATGEASCALVSNGSVYCWGVDLGGTAGGTNPHNTPTPTLVQGLPGAVTAIAVSPYQACALISGGTVWCWGGSTLVPSAVSGLVNVKAISRGDNFMCALQTSGAVLCWGSGYNGEIGNGASGVFFNPTAVSGLSSGVLSIASGGDHTCAIRSDSSVVCWGNMFYIPAGGTQQTWQYLTPTAILYQGQPLTGASSLASGEYGSCALMKNGSVYCWSGNNGTSTPSFAATAVPGLTGVTQITVGMLVSCALQNGVAKCWGNNANGIMGANVTLSATSITPVDIFAH